MRTDIVIALLAILAAARADAGEHAPAVAALGAGSAEVRAEARAALLEAGEAALDDLRAGLGADDLRVACACADLIGEMRLRRARPDVVALLSRKDLPPILARAGCRAMAKVGDYRDVGLLGGLLPDRPAAALALAGIGDADGLPPVRSAFAAGARSPEIAYALAVLGDEEAGLAALLSRVGEESRRGRAALHWLRRYAGTDPGTEREAWETWLRRRRLAKGLGHPDWEVAERTLASLRADPPPTAVEDLVAIATDTGEDRATRAKSIEALGLLGATPAQRVLLDLLWEDEDGRVRVYAAEALGRCGEPWVATELAWYLVFDEEPFRKLSAKNTYGDYYTIDSEVSKALVRMGVSGGLDYLIRQLGEDHRVRVYHHALGVLREVTGREFGFCPDARTEDRHEAAARWRRWFDENRGAIGLTGRVTLDDPEYARRVGRLVDGLGTYKFLSMSRKRQILDLLGETVIPALVEGLGRREVHIRVHCAEVLGWMGAKPARGALGKALDDPRMEVRKAAASALADMGPGVAADAVREVLAGRGPDDLGVRIEAARAVARMEGADAVAALREALARDDNDTRAFRIEAWYSLGAHGDAEAVDRLADLLDTETVAIRQVVADRLHVLTGEDPGVSAETVSQWRDRWEVSRERYTPAGPGGSGR